VPMTAQVRMNSERGYDMVIRPFFDAAARANRTPLAGIPGGGN